MSIWLNPGFSMGFSHADLDRIGTLGGSMKRISVVLVGLAVALAAAPAAFATTIGFNVNGVGTGGAGTASAYFDVTGTMITTGANAGDVQITGLSDGWVVFSGPSGSQTITGLASGMLYTGATYTPPGTLGAGSPNASGDYDDLIIPDGTGWKLDNYGLAFILANGDDLQVYFAAVPGDPTNIKAVIADTTSQDAASTYLTSASNMKITEAPEPGTLIMFGSGLLGLAGLLRFKFARKSI
jgi:hypothetical protein